MKVAVAVQELEIDPDNLWLLDSRTGERKGPIRGTKMTENDLKQNWRQRTRKGKPVDAWTNLTAFVFKGDSNQHTVVPKGVTRTTAEALALEACRPAESLPWTTLPIESIPKPKR